ncbi:hypothetical protein ACFSSC_10710 [Corynebacterium mendelii]|uniref:Uncharacterized protein n=1 Tax=Corynebacterium mendelii TaxID=2765362 RepID=A0A939E2A2_9CORY|nr:hypothetical protein [Corynebacterium mendelii]MBN9644371.1 hypothetical protein [Corynebacterium mendelii]
MNATRTRTPATPRHTAPAPTGQLTWRSALVAALDGNRWMLALIIAISMLGFLALSGIHVALTASLAVVGFIPQMLKTMTAGYRGLGVPRGTWLKHLPIVTAVLLAAPALPMVVSALVVQSLLAVILLVVLIGFYLLQVLVWPGRIWPVGEIDTPTAPAKKGFTRSKWTDWSLHESVRNPKNFAALANAYVQWSSVCILLLVMVVIVPVMGMTVKPEGNAALVFATASSAVFGGSFGIRSNNVAAWLNLGGTRAGHWQRTVKKLLPSIAVTAVFVGVLSWVFTPESRDAGLAFVAANSLKVAFTLFGITVVLTYVQYGQLLAAYATAAATGLAAVIAINITHPLSLGIPLAGMVLSLVVSRRLAMNFDNTRGDYNPQRNTRAAGS